MVAGELTRTIAPLRLLEREAELAALEAMLAAARLGDGRLVVVEGSAGIGKTRLLAEVRALAQAGDFEVLTARGGELEGEFAFGIVRQLFEAPLAAATPELRAELLAGAAELSASLFASAPTSAAGEATESSFAMLHGLYWLTANFASRTPTLLVVDDLHWADEPSLRWLHYLARRLEGLPVLLLVGTRPPEQANLPVLVGELLADPAGVVMRPGGLGRESAAALARERLGDEPAAAFAAALETGSGGNPLYLVALLDAVWRQGLPPTAEHAPDVLELGPRAVSYGVSTRLGRLPHEATALLRAAAILGDRTELPLAAALAGIDSGAALTAASALVRADLLRHENPLEFTHPVVRSAVLEHMSADERTRAHREAAALLLDRGSLPEQAATYLVRTIPSGDRFLVATLRRAAERSFAHGAPEAATAYLRRALEEPPEGEDRAEVLGELGLAETHTDAAAAAEHLSQAISQLNDPTRRTNAVLAYAHVLNLFGRRVRESAELLQETSHRLGDNEPALADRVDALLIIACRYDAELYPIASAQWETRRKRVSERGLGSGLMLVVGSIQEALAGVSRKRAVDLGRKALASDLPHSEDRMYLTSALAALAMAGELDEAQAGLERVIAVAERSGDRLTAAGHRLWRGLVHYEAGEPPTRRARPDPRADPVLAGLDAARIPRGVPDAGVARARFDRRGRAACSPTPRSTMSWMLTVSIASTRGVDSDSNRAPRTGRLPTSARSGGWPSQSTSSIQPSFRGARRRRLRCSGSGEARRRERSRARSSSCRGAGVRLARWASRCARSAWSRADKPVNCCCARRSTSSRIRRRGSNTRGRSSTWVRSSAAEIAAARRESSCVRESSSPINAAPPR